MLAVLLAHLGLAMAVRGGTQGGSVPFTLAAAGLGLGLSVGPLLTQALVHVPPTRAADASGLLTTTVQLGQLMGVTVLGSVYLTRAAAVHSSAVTAGTAASGTAAARPPDGARSWPDRWGIQPRSLLPVQRPIDQEASRGTGRAAPARRPAAGDNGTGEAQAAKPRPAPAAAPDAHQAAGRC
jgi:hypothetical protein